ncbi:MAG: peptide chain release factor N(5)-glutamine methyltransferase [Alphaproteobacteria bacterium]|nr:peptide chain release factor N(5)-glutamine methyltransferase [Alphaproteobacteria bacterium]
MNPSEPAEALRNAAARLAAVGIEEPMREARLLAREAPDGAVFDAFIARREKREPVAYILGRKEFWSLEFEVTPAVLIPRPDSETLIETALKELKDTPPNRILDLGTGSGCLLITLLTEFPNAAGTGLDISREALAVARRNARRHSVDTRAAFVEADFANAPHGRFDLVVANPPYIADSAFETLDTDVRDHEPRLALTAGRDGLDAIQTIARTLHDVMKPDALALIEIGHDQGESAVKVLENEGLNVRRVVKDLAGHDRVIVATLPQGASP